MKYKIELESLLSAVLYCAEVDNNKEVWERWNTLNVSEQIEKLSNVTFFEEEPQTIEQAIYMRQRAQKVLAEYRETDKQIAHFFDTTEETPENKYLYACWSMIEQHLLSESFELSCYIKSAEPKQEQTTRERLLQKITDKLLICFEPKEPDNNNLAEQILGYINNTLDAQKDGKKRYQDILKKGIDNHPNHIFGKFEPYVIIRMFKEFGIELHYDTVNRWRKIWNTNTDKEQKK